MQYNVLVVHNLRSFSATLRSMVDYIECFERYVPQHRYYYHRIIDPVTPALRDIPFDVVIVESSALGICRWRPRELYYQQKDNWSFLAASDAVKVAFPQDDYHQTNTLDELFEDFQFDLVYSVMPDQLEMLYPRTYRRARLSTVLTGYVDDDSIEMFESHARPFAARDIDLGQRVTMYPPVGGRHARMKGLLAKAVAEAAQARGFAVDVSTDDSNRVLGDDWLKFLGNCRFVTGAESGVSIWDPDGNVHDKVREYLTLHPDAPYEEVEAACFPGADGKFIFSAVSPRLFESAMMRCCQILVEAPYLGALRPFEHYIPVAPDLSNIGDAVDLMRDSDGAVRRVQASYEALVDNKSYRYSTLANRVMSDISEVAARKRVPEKPANQVKRQWEEHRRLLQLSKEQKAKRDVSATAIGYLRWAIPAPIRRQIKKLIAK